MNRVIGIVSIILVIVLITLILILSSFRSSSTNNTTTITPVPTSSVDFDSDNTSSQDFSDVGSESEIDFLLNQNEKNKLALLNAKLPSQSDDFSMDYSDLLDQYYLQDKESSNSAQKIEDFLNNNGVSDIFKTWPELLTRSKQNATQQKQSAEQRYRSTMKSYEKSRKLKLTPTQSPAQIDAKLIGGFVRMFTEIDLIHLPRPTVTPEPEEGESSSNTTPTSGPTTPIGSVVIGDTSNATCEAGSDGGVQDGYAKSQLYKIRVCNVQGIIVNAQISDEVNRLLTDAKNSGLQIAGGGFRTMERQIELYRQRCGSYNFNNPPSRSCSKMIARPGFSNHQMGLAIDFTCSGSLIQSHSLPCFNWLAANARNYGLINYEREPWHWSINGR